MKTYRFWFREKVAATNDQPRMRIRTVRGLNELDATCRLKAGCRKAGRKVDLIYNTVEVPKGVPPKAVEVTYAFPNTWA